MTRWPFAQAEDDLLSAIVADGRHRRRRRRALAVAAALVAVAIPWGVTAQLGTPEALTRVATEGGEEGGTSHQATDPEDDAPHESSSAEPHTTTSVIFADPTGHAAIYREGSSTAFGIPGTMVLVDPVGDADPAIDITGVHLSATAEDLVITFHVEDIDGVPDKAIQNGEHVVSTGSDGVPEGYGNYPPSGTGHWIQFMIGEYRYQLEGRKDLRRNSWSFHSHVATREYQPHCGEVCTQPALTGAVSVTETTLTLAVPLDSFSRGGSGIRGAVVEAISAGGWTEECTSEAAAPAERDPTTVEGPDGSGATGAGIRRDGCVPRRVEREQVGNGEATWVAGWR